MSGAKNEFLLGKNVKLYVKYVIFVKIERKQLKQDWCKIFSKDLYLGTCAKNFKLKTEK